MIRLRSNAGENHHLWKGDDVGIQALHIYVKRRLPKPDKCEGCKVNPPHDLANMSGKYLRDLDDWQWLCRKCHMISDGRLSNFMVTSYKKKDMNERKCFICNSKETHIRKNSDRPMWYFYDNTKDRFICHNCYMSRWNSSVRR